MPTTLEGRLVIAISSRALFDLDESNKVFEIEGVAKYSEYQVAHENEALGLGVAYPLVRRLLDLRYPHSDANVAEVILVSRNDANTGLRVFNSIEKHKLPITRAVFTCGRPVYPYLSALNADLFLSANAEDVRLALDNGHAAATILTGLNLAEDTGDELRVAFDGDAVLFSDEAERVYAEKGLVEYQQTETEKSAIPLNPGPFKAFLEALNRVQRAYADTRDKPIRTALVTARNAPSHKRAILTLRSWGITIDEVFFLGGLDKTPILQAFRPHVFFDDQKTHCDRAAGVVPTGHVPTGIRNQGNAEPNRS